jgi:DNA-binding response OmpR family regulator
MADILLLVEDDSEVRAVISELLSLDEIETIEMPNGYEAWKFLDTNPRASAVSIVLSDVAMPKLNGFQLLSKIRGDLRYRSLPVILTSGDPLRARDELQDKNAKIEPNAFFPKPFDFGKIVEKIRELIRSR